VNVYASNGYLVDGSKIFTGAARCVRRGYASLVITEPRLVRTTPVTDEPVVDDTRTGLAWQGCAAGFGGDLCDRNATRCDPQRGAGDCTWQAALSYCEGLSWGAQTDWRLPNNHELLSIADSRKSQPAVDATLFPATGNTSFWTSTPAAESAAQAWVVNFTANGSWPRAATDFYSVRCVRQP